MANPLGGAMVPNAILPQEAPKNARQSTLALAAHGEATTNTRKSAFADQPYEERGSAALLDSTTSEYQKVLQREKEKVQNRKAAAQRRQQHKEESKLKVVCRKIAENPHFSLFTTLLTIQALFGDDIRLLATEKPADGVFGAICVVLIVIFTFEILVTVIGKDDYLNGFFFWLDIVSTLSLLLDYPALSESMFGSDDDSSSANALKAGRASRAGSKAGRVVRIIRLIRIVKLYKAYMEAEQKKRRLERARANPGEAEDDLLFEMDDDENDDNKQQRESRVGKKLSDMTTRRLIVLILVMLFGFPAFEAEIAAPLGFIPTSSQYGADMVRKSYLEWEKVSANNGPSAQVRVLRDYYEDQLLTYLYYHNWHAGQECKSECRLGTPDGYFLHLFWVGVGGNKIMETGVAPDSVALSSLSTEKWETTIDPQGQNFQMQTIPKQYTEALGKPWDEKCGNRRGVSLIKDEDYPVPCPQDIRYNERQIILPTLNTRDEFEDFHFSFYLDKRALVRAESYLNIIRTIFICIVLGSGAMLFSKDANELVLNPLEQMISKVEKIRDDPLYAMKMGDEEFKKEEIQRMRTKKMSTPNLGTMVIRKVRCDSGSKKKQEPMETLILEKTIIKIGTLLALGFGEAGANIIGQNMRGGDSASVNVMIPGHRINCVIGVITIHHFAIATEVLQSKVMTFVNQIAEIVHGVVDEFHGAPNRNNGDSFLVVWRCEWEIMDEKKKLPTQGDRTRARQKTQKVTEMALVALVKILGSTSRSPVIADYQGHPGLLQRISAYRVQLGFGLHYGWAIEGAIGSEYKIDASYLSPNVNIATRLEAATRREYGVYMLLSDSVVAQMGLAVAGQLRLIDRALITGSKWPMGLYTFDLHPHLITPDSHPNPDEKVVWNSRLRFKARQVLATQKEEKATMNMEEYLNDMEDTKMMRALYTEEFQQIYGMGFHNYTAGEWQVASKLFSETRGMIQGDEDGPSVALLNFMAAQNNVAPPNWVGFRELTEN